MSCPPPSLKDILYVLNHVFLPPKLPQEDDARPDYDIALCSLVYNASLEFSPILPESQRRQWNIVTQMLNMVLDTIPVLDTRMVEKIMHLNDGGRFF